MKHAAIEEALGGAGAFAGDLLHLDPPEHTRLRRLLAGPFSIRNISDHREDIERIVDRLLDAMVTAGPPADLKSAFAIPVSLATHCLLLGIPERDGQRFGQMLGVAVDPASTADDVIAEFRSFSDYLRPILARKRVGHADDLMSLIAKTPGLTDDEVFSLVLMLFLSGHDTTATMLALGTLVLLQYPRQLALLRADPATIGPAVEELLRYLTIFQAGAFTRIAREDVTFDGVTIRAGDSISVSLAAANRDPARFESPDVLDIARTEGGHLAFGQGPHMCVGQHLARLEIQVGLTRLFERLPSLRLATPFENVPFLSGQHLVYGVQQLPVVW